MDAQITKERLSNFLSYDWLKIVASAVAAVFFFIIVFTTVSTVPTSAQTMEIYSRDDLSGGDDSQTIGERLEDNVFSYEILVARMECFSGEYSAAAFSARRAAGEGDCAFYSDNETTYNEDGSVKTQSALRKDMLEIGEAYLNVQTYMEECALYLDSFYGGDYVSGELDLQAVSDCFYRRNGSDKRFRTDEKKQLGVIQERERIERLKRDYIAVLGYFDEGLLSYTVCRVGEEEAEFPAAIRVGGSRMRGLTKLVYYTEEREDGTKVRSSETVNLALFDNGERDGDLRYERISFIRYLVDTYKDTQA